LATFVVTQPRPEERTVRQLTASPSGQALVLAALTLAALVIHGYHPYSEDGGIYIAAAQHALQPQLFPHLSQFADAHVSCLFFSRIMTGVATLTRLSLTWVFFLGYLASIYLTLRGLHRILQTCLRGEAARWFGLILFTATMSMPVAGTSIIMADPYLTSRSLGLPMVLFAIAEALQDKPRWMRIVIFLIPGSLLHPLIAACGIYLIALILALRSGSRAMVYGVIAFALTTSTAVHWLAPVESAAYREAAVSRTYWFLTRWSWDEIVGVIAPVLLLFALDRFRPTTFTDAFSTFLRALCLGGIVTIAVNLLFAHPESGNHLVASLQPLRFFTFIYLAMAVALGSLLALLPRRIIGGFIIAALAAFLFLVQRNIYPSTVHMELPWRALSNEWERAFLWIREHTPQDAVFAMDSDYHNLPGEDTHVFRAIALRDALPDYSKDGGIAAVKPSIASDWVRGVALQRDLDHMDDTARIARMKPAGVTWVILRPSANTRLNCPYTDRDIRICRIP